MRQWTFAIILSVALAGCVPTEDQVIQLGQDVDVLMEKIDDQQAKIVGEIDTVQERVIAVNDAIKAAKTLPEKAAAGIEASRPWNPYADEMAAILGLTTVVGGLFAGKKIAASNKKYTAHKRGVERAMMSASPETRTEVYDAIGKARAAIKV